MARSRSRAGTSLTWIPSMRISPEVGSSRPATIRMVVVLPQPEGPSRTSSSLSAISSDSSSRAMTLPQRFTRRSMLIVAMLIVATAGTGRRTPPRDSLREGRSRPGSPRPRSRETMVGRWSSFAPYHEAAIDPDDLAGDERGAVAGQEQNNLRHLPRLAEPAERMRLVPAGDQAFGIGVRREDLLIERRHDRARCDGV